ncbi:pilus assembly protein [Gimesia sp.]|uniref:TadE/TadG family type IV pilus assembly protein n=1 Tax=Gimesia sp. TaxID=2024833 RepID=UPI000C58A682|nr:pilus assembly protein [Gimesia sp.]MAX39166.1 pilus assembly protein TadE [Gimesia sp.]HAH44677.1 pilus assembly protein TadE [Planctomycetaceae bacterium]
MRVKRVQHHSQQPERRGFLSMELALVLPIFGIVLFALLEFTLLFYARADVVEASRIGARLATLPGITQENVQQEVLKILPPQLGQGAVIQTEMGEHAGDIVMVAVSIPMNLASPNLLWPVGYDLTGQNLYSETRMIKE